MTVCVRVLVGGWMCVFVCVCVCVSGWLDVCVCVCVCVYVRHAKVKLGTGGNKPISWNLISCELKGRKSERRREKRREGVREREKRKKEERH